MLEGFVFVQSSVYVFGLRQFTSHSKLATECLDLVFLSRKVLCFPQSDRVVRRRKSGSRLRYSIYRNEFMNNLSHGRSNWQVNPPVNSRSYGVVISSVKLPCRRPSVESPRRQNAVSNKYQSGFCEGLRCVGTGTLHAGFGRSGQMKEKLMC